MMASKARPHVVYALLADDHRLVDGGKVDALGIFSELRGWATPLSRDCSIVISVAGVGAKETAFSLWLRSGSDKPRRVLAGHLTTNPPHLPWTFAQRISLRASNFGPHALGVTLGKRIGSRNTFWLPLEVIELPWPKLPRGQKLATALEDPRTMQSARVSLTCNKCHAQYIFQKNLDPDAPIAEYAHEFPTDGVFVCTKCGTKHHLKNIEGGLLAQLGKVMETAQ